MLLTPAPPKPAFHLSCPKVQPAAIPPIGPSLGGSGSDSPRGSPRTPRHLLKPFKKREVFQDKSPFHGGTFSQYPPYLPDPVPPRQIRTEKPAIFTVHVKTKRDMPVGAPWNEAGAQGDIDATMPTKAMGSTLSPRKRA